MKSRLMHHLDYPKDVDRMMVILLDSLNSVPGCRTLYSCDGHGNSPFYICMGMCSKRAKDEVSRIFREMVEDVEVDTGFPPYGIEEYEDYVGVYSMGLGTMAYSRRKSRIMAISRKVMELVPENRW